MATRIDQTKYPNLLGNGSDKVGLAILGFPISSYTGSVYDITVNNGNYMNYSVLAAYSFMLLLELSDFFENF